MDRARTEALPEMTAILRQSESGPLGYLGRIERDLSLWREIDRGTDPGRIAAMLTDHNLLDSGAPRNGDWTALNMDITKFLLWQLGQRNPEASLEALARSNLQTLGPFFASWAETDLPAALKAADEHWVLLERVYSIAAALTSLAGRNPAGAIRLAASLRREGEGEDPVPGVLAGLGENHPRQALSFLLSPENQLSPEEVSGLVNLTVKKLAGEPGGSPWEPLNQLADSRDPAILRAAAESLGQHAALTFPVPQEALAILDRLPPETLEKALTSGMAVALYRADPAQADRLLAGLPEAAAAAAIGAAAEAAFQTGRPDFTPDPALSQSILSRLPFGQQLEFIGTWQNYGVTDNCRDWLDKVEDPFQRDQFAEKFTVGMAASDPGSAASMAAFISEEARRENALAAVFTIWRAKDPDEASSWEAGQKSHSPE